MAHPNDHPSGRGLSDTLRKPILVRIHKLLIHNLERPRLIVSLCLCRDFISGLIGFVYGDNWRTRIRHLIRLINANGR